MLKPKYMIGLAVATISWSGFLFCVGLFFLYFKEIYFDWEYTGLLIIPPFGAFFGIQYLRKQPLLKTKDMRILALITSIGFVVLEFNPFFRSNFDSWEIVSLIINGGIAIFGVIYLKQNIQSRHNSD